MIYQDAKICKVFFVLLRIFRCREILVFRVGILQGCPETHAKQATQRVHKYDVYALGSIMSH